METKDNPTIDTCWCGHKASKHKQLDQFLFHCGICDNKKRNGVKANKLLRTFEDYPALFLDEDHELQENMPRWMLGRSGNDTGTIFRVAYSMGLPWNYFVNHYWDIIAPDDQNGRRAW